MISSPKQTPRIPVGDDWLEELQQLFAEEFPESECEAQRAVEGVGPDRVPDNRFRECEQ